MVMLVPKIDFCSSYIDKTCFLFLFLDESVEFVGIMSNFASVAIFPFSKSIDLTTTQWEIQWSMTWICRHIVGKTEIIFGLSIYEINKKKVDFIFSTVCLRFIYISLSEKVEHAFSAFSD